MKKLSLFILCSSLLAAFSVRAQETETEQASVESPEEESEGGESVEESEGVEPSGQDEDLSAIKEKLEELEARDKAREKEMAELAAERETPVEPVESEEATWVDDLVLPREVTSADDLDVLIQKLQELKTKFKDYARIVFSKGKG